jgi:hypothetical protein
MFEDQVNGRNEPMARPEPQELARRAEEVYEQELKVKLEAAHLNEFVAIEPDSGDCFLGRTPSEATQGLHKPHPSRRGYIMRVGHPAALHMQCADACLAPTIYE